MEENKIPELEQDIPQKNDPSKTFPFVLLLVIFIALSSAVFILLEKKDGDIEVVEIQTVRSVNAIRVFDDIEIEAHSAVVWDVDREEIIYSKNGESQMPLASISKVMTALVARELSEDKEILVTVKNGHLEAEGDNGLVENERWRLSDISDFMLVVSSNDGAKAIASALGAAKSIGSDLTPEEQFIAHMNRRADELELTQTYFLNESGLDINEEYLSGSYGSSKDVAMLFNYILRNNPEILEATTSFEIQRNSEQNIEHEGENTNPYVNLIPRLIASKTGFTDLAGGNLVVAFDAGLMQPYVVVVLGSSAEGRFSDMLALVDATTEYVSY